MARRHARTRRRYAVRIGGAVLLLVLLAFGLWGGSGGPPPPRPPGAGLPPVAPLAGAQPSTLPLAARIPAPDPGPRIAEEEQRLLVLRATRAQLEQEIAALRQEAEERRQAMPGRKDTVPEARTGATPPMPPAAGGAPRPEPQAAPPAQDGAPLRVFVHHRADSRPGAAAAEEVADSLREAGIGVAAVRGTPFVPSTPVVRYFHEEDQAAAARLASRLGRGWAIQDFRAFVPQPPPQTLEVWLPAN